MYSEFNSGCTGFILYFILDINFLNKSAAVNIDSDDKIFFNNIFNDILITFSITLFYLLPFLIVKLIKIEKNL